jgi:hypothetical protein
VLKDSKGQILKAPEEKKDEVLKDSFGRVIKEAPKVEKPKEVHMVHGKEKKKMGEEEDDRFIKHQSFENYLVEMKRACKDKHLPSQKCQNCSAYSQLSYKVNKNCKEHKPYPHGMCNKCLPPTVVLARQSYRHVDYVSFMNFKEMS